jgi:hypothetical protein
VTVVGGGLTDPMTTRGDIIVRNAANATARLAIGTTGKVLQSDGTDISWQAPAGGTFSGAAAYGSADVTVPTGGQAVIALNSELFDTDAYHDTSTNNDRFTCPSGKDGYFAWFFTPRLDSSKVGYLFVEKVNVSGSGSASGILLVQGTTALFDGSGQGGMSLSGIIDLKATDYIHAQGLVTGTLKILTNARPWFAIARLGS